MCLTSNQQTVPELRRPEPPPLRRDAAAPPVHHVLHRQPARLAHDGDPTRSQRAVDAFGLTDREVRDILVYGFKRSFFPGTYLEKRAYVRQMIDYADMVLEGEARKDA